MADDLPILLFATPPDLEAWLEENHEQPDGFWLKIAKKGSGEQSVTYAEALELALCFGWIDSQKRGLDEKFFLQRFTPRRPRGRWSKINREKVEALLVAGAMRPAGLAEVEAAKADGRWEAAYEGAAHGQGPRRPAARARWQRGRPRVLRHARQQQPLRDRLPAQRREKAGDPRAPPAQIRRHAGARREDPPVARSVHSPDGSRPAREHPRRRRRARLPRRPGLGVGRARCLLLRGDDQPAGDAARPARAGGAALDALAAGRGEVRRRHRQVALPHRRRPRRSRRC